MPPFLLRWLLLVIVRFITLTALIYTFVTSIVQLHHSLQAVGAPQSSTTVLPTFSADNKTTTIAQVPLNKLYGDSDVPLTTTGPFFTVLHYLFLLASLLVITCAELPLPSFIQRKLRLQILLEKTLPQLCHKYNSTGMLGLWLLLLSAAINSRPLDNLEKAGGWLLLLAGSLNIIAVSVFSHAAHRLQSDFPISFFPQGPPLPQTQSEASLFSRPAQGRPRCGWIFPTRKQTHYDGERVRLGSAYGRSYGCF